MLTAFIFRKNENKRTCVVCYKLVRQVKARRFFRIRADTSYGHLARKKKQLTQREEEVREARRVYPSGIREAWNIYTENNELVKKGEKALDMTIDEAYKLIYRNEEKMSEEEYARANSLYVKATRKAYEDFSGVVKRVQTLARYLKQKQNQSKIWTAYLPKPSSILAQNKDFEWWGRWDLNPGSPTPQAGILDQSSHPTPSITTTELKAEAIRRPHRLGRRPSGYSGVCLRYRSFFFLNSLPLSAYSQDT